MREIRTPVLIWADLPPNVRLADDPEAQNRNSPALPSRQRCRARSRGNTYAANQAHVPLDGGYRCQRRAVGEGEGLCSVHWRDATVAVRRRANELHRLE